MPSNSRAEIVENVIDVTESGRVPAYEEHASQFLDSLPGPYGPGNFLCALDRSVAGC